MSDATVESVMEELRSKGKESTRAIYARHGLPADRTFGVSTADLKGIAKAIKGRQELAYELYATRNTDAMYLAGMVADGAKMTPELLQTWAEGAVGMQMISEYTVPWVTVDHPGGHDLALRWIASDNEQVAASGWCTLAGLVATQPDSSLDLAEIDGLLERIVREIPDAKNRVRHTMNGFVIAVGSFVAPLSAKAKSAAERIGAVTVDMGDTACKVPDALVCIAKVEAAGKLGVKKKTIRC